MGRLIIPEASIREIFKTYLPTLVVPNAYIVEMIDEKVEDTMPKAEHST